MYLFSSHISKAENTVHAIAKKKRIVTNYQLKHLTFSEIIILNPSIRWELICNRNDNKLKRKIQKEIADYNQYIDTLQSIPGFIDAFVRNYLCLSRQFVERHWSKEIADFVFSKKDYFFLTNLSIFNDFLLDRRFLGNYEVQIGDKCLNFTIGKDNNAYPTSAYGYKIIWNWIDSGHDFFPPLWEMLGSPYSKNKSETPSSDEVTYSFDAYEQFRYEPVEAQFVAIFHKLEKLNYIKTYTIYSEDHNPYWYFCGKSDGSIDVAFVDLSFIKNRLLKEQINLLLWTNEKELKKKKYFLTDASNHQFLSDEPGQYGGHYKLKIYGRLDCPSALRYIKKGQYVRNRVFFANKETAVAAGYRPCSCCMPNEYKMWKNGKEMR
jgi:hypothetical protein